MPTICVEPTGVNFLVYPSDNPGDVEIFTDIVKALACAFRKQAAGGVDAPPISKTPIDLPANQERQGKSQKRSKRIK